MWCHFATYRLAWLLVLVALAGVMWDAPARAQGPVTIVALGASNTQGWGVSPSEAYPARLQHLLRSKGLDARVLNAGVAGETTHDMLARLDAAVPAGTHIVVLQPGTNDERLGRMAERNGNIEAIRGRLAGRGTKVIVVENDVLDALPRSEVRADGVHFTPAGYALLAERILPLVLAALDR